MTIYTMTVGEKTFGAAGISEARRLAKELTKDTDKVTTVEIKTVRLGQRDASTMIAAALKKGSKEFTLPEGELVDVIVVRPSKQAALPGVKAA